MFVPTEEFNLCEDGDIEGVLRCNVAYEILCAI